MMPSQLGLHPVTGNRTEKESLNQWRAAKVFLVKHLKVKICKEKKDPFSDVAGATSQYERFISRQKIQLIKPIKYNSKLTLKSKGITYEK